MDESGKMPDTLFSEAEIGAKVRELAERISSDYREKGELLLVGILKGAFIFLADLSRALSIPRRVDFMALSSYGAGGDERGEVRLIMDLRVSVRGKQVLIVEDIVDSGDTLAYLRKMLLAREPASLRICTLLRKKSTMRVEVPVEYLGFDIPDLWVVGYGLDYRDLFRTLPYIGVIDPAALPSAD